MEHKKSNALKFISNEIISVSIFLPTQELIAP